MKKEPETNTNISANTEAANTLKMWKTPELRILPVPTKTQGGAFNKNDQDDIFYKKS